MDGAIAVATLLEYEIPSKDVVKKILQLWGDYFFDKKSFNSVKFMTYLEQHWNDDFSETI